MSGTDICIRPGTLSCPDDADMLWRAVGAATDEAAGDSCSAAPLNSADEACSDNSAASTPLMAGRVQLEPRYICLRRGGVILHTPWNKWHCSEILRLAPVCLSVTKWFCFKTFECYSVTFWVQPGPSARMLSYFFVIFKAPVAVKDPGCSTPKGFGKSTFKTTFVSSKLHQMTLPCLNSLWQLSFSGLFSLTDWLTSPWVPQGSVLGSMPFWLWTDPWAMWSHFTRKTLGIDLLWTSECSLSSFQTVNMWNKSVCHTDSSR